MEYLTRRDLIKYGWLAGAVLFTPSVVLPVFTMQSARGMYPLTISVLKVAYKNKMDAHSSYVEFSRQALKDNYPNICYLFTTFATSESIHANLFKKPLADLGWTLTTTATGRLTFLPPRKISQKRPNMNWN